ncbi:TPR repeat-containing protein [Caballeronia cordobensis]|uniref:protein O-GlcNAc transferase n=1 Tax=Caballeronia cordobensis TaxID=1353886 RepID=A0A158IKX7_CABCO|nr:tetratricopeptide repeat protein [Caballeronia cordobensis]SAL57292.1 TPR repeat-containing protein [Caballeronia cordobensis]
MSFDPNVYQSAAAHFSGGQYHEALSALGAMLEASPAHPEALNLAATCCYCLNRHAEAESHWRRAIAEHPDIAGNYANLGNLLLAQGRLSDAEAMYRQAIRLKPDFAEAHYNLGNLLNRLGRHEEGAAALLDALSVRPDFAEAHFNLGNLRTEQGRADDAERAFRAAIAARPAYADACNNLGNLLRASGRTKEARAALRQAVVLRPDFAEGHLNLGHVWRDAGRWARALALYRRACDVRPDYADAWRSRAAVLSHQERFADAEAAYRQVLALDPGDAAAHGALAYALDRQERVREAEVAYRAALALRPDAAELHYNLGVLLGDQKRLDEAEAAYRNAISHDPDYAEAHNNLGRIVRDLGRLPEAAAILGHAVALRPDVREAHNNLAATLKDMGAMAESIAEFRRAVDCAPDNECVHRNLNYALTYHAEDPHEILDECLRFAARHEAPLRPAEVDYPNSRDPSRRVRIGYVAPDFNMHCQSMFTAPVFGAHDHAAFEIVCYSSTSDTDHITASMRTKVDLWRDVHALSDEALAQRIRDDRIDVLVDLTLHMSQGRPLLFARCPAPVQVQWLGYPGTTGSSAIRYRLTDPWIDPPGRPDVDARYSERSIRLPETFWCVDPRVTTQHAPEVGPLPALANGHITFGCLNNPCKASDRTLNMWAAVLATTPGARLVLLSPPGARERAAERLGALGVDIARIEFLDYQPRDAYLRTYDRIDIGLDTFPYNGHTTSLDALWMGVPVPSRAGETAVSRAGLSFLMNLGLGDLAAHDDAAYVDIVSRLACDLPRLAHLRASLRARLEASPMMDAPRFTRHLEAAYRAMWQAWRAAPD